MMKKYGVVIFMLLGLGFIALTTRSSQVCQVPVLKKAAGSSMAVAPQAAAEAVIPPMSMIDQSPQGTKVYAYYFHGDFRCETCRKIEQYSREAIEAAYALEIKAGRVEFKEINIEKPGNEHFVKDYQLYTKALILSLVKDGREVKSKNLQRVWEYANDKQRFVGYVQEEMSAYLKEL